MKTSPFALLLLPLGLVACGGDDKNESANQNAGTGATAGSGGAAGSGGGGGAGGETPTVPPPEPDDCITDPQAGAQTLTCPGQEIEFLLTVPEMCLEQACGLILDVHGWVMTGPMQADEDDLNVLGPEAGYITIHPTAVLNASNQNSWRGGVDDPTLADILQRVAAVFHVDGKRIHLTGFSQGGMMTWRMLCDYTDLFASVAPAAAGIGYTPATGICNDGGMPTPEVPILFLHGTDDGLSPWATAEARRDIIVEQWGMAETEVVSTDADHVWTRYENDNGTVFEMLAHDYTSASMDFLRGHCFPGSDSGSMLACQQQAAFHWGEAVLAFFQAHPKP